MTAGSTKLTPKRRERFLEVLAWCGNVSEAARCAGVPRGTAYKWKKEDAAFAQAWDDAIEESTDILEMEARRRAIEGYDEPVFHNGKPVGYIKKYSPTLLMFLLNGNRPEKYKRRGSVEHTGKGGGPIDVNAKATIVQYPVNKRDK